MNNFKFYNPTKIIFGAGAIKELAGEIPQNARVLITYGGGSVRKNGVLEEVYEALQGFETGEFGGIEPNPSYETLMRCVEKVRQDKFDFLLAVGGGSVIDGTKFIAAAVPYQAEAWEIVKTRACKVVNSLTFGTVLTLPASGSEMNCGSVISHRQLRAKLPFAHPSLFPRFSILDPTKTYSLPPRQIANGVIDAFVHITEQYLTYPVEGKPQDRFAEGLLLTLVEEGPRALAEPENYNVRANIMWCAALALNGLIGAGVPQDWATHMIGHEITALCGLDHAQTLAVVMPAMLKIRSREKKEKLLQYAERIWGIKTGSEDDRISGAIEKTKEYFAVMQAPTSLSAYNINGETITTIVGRLKDHGMTNLGERRNVTPEVAEMILRECL